MGHPFVNRDMRSVVSSPTASTAHNARRFTVGTPGERSRLALLRQCSPRLCQSIPGASLALLGHRSLNERGPLLVVAQVPTLIVRTASPLWVAQTRTAWPFHKGSRMAWVYLVSAGILEIVWAYAMKQSHGLPPAVATGWWVVRVDRANEHCRPVGVRLVLDALGDQSHSVPDDEVSRRPCARGHPRHKAGRFRVR